MKTLKGLKQKQFLIFWACLKYLAKFKNIQHIQFINQQKVQKKWSTGKINFSV